MRKTLSSRIVLLAVIVAIVLLAPAPGRAQKMPTLGPHEGRRVGDLAIDFKARGLDGQDYRLKDFRSHKVVLLVFWATWCMPCIEEVPQLRDTYAKYRDQGLEILGVTMPLDQTLDGVRGFVEKHQMGYPILWDEGQAIMDRYRVSAIPQLFLIGRDGVIRYAGGGLPGNYEDLLQKALAQDAASRTAAR